MSENSIFFIDGLEVEPGSGAEVHWTDRDFFEVIYQGKSFKGEILSRDIENSKLRIKLNHRVFELKKRFVLDDLIAELGLDKVKVKQLKKITSPMPGRILNIQVQVGDHVKVGEPILSLEAMKMENILKSDGEGVVKSIVIAKDQVVDKGELLIEFE